VDIDAAAMRNSTNSSAWCLLLARDLLPPSLPFLHDHFTAAHFMQHVGWDDNPSIAMRTYIAMLGLSSQPMYGRHSRESGNPFCSGAKSKDGFPLSRE
jgi:hypothetical protein